MRSCPVTVVIPTFREADNIGLVLTDLRNQTSVPAEVVIVDACSDDGTTSVAEREWSSFESLRVLWAPKALPGRGRNVGIEAAEYDIVLLADAGLRLPPDWVESLAEPILRGGADVTFGGFVPDARSATDDIMELLTACNASEVDGRQIYYPTTASLAIKRRVWLAAGRFPENLRACEDSLFFQSLFKLGNVKPAVAPKATVSWSMGAGFKYVTRKMYQGAGGEVRAGIISRKTVFLAGIYPMMLAILLTPIPILPAGPRVSRLDLLAFQSPGSQEPEDHETSVRTQAWTVGGHGDDAVGRPCRASWIRGGLHHALESA